jgi:hypothetical protein
MLRMTEGNDSIDNTTSEADRRRFRFIAIGALLSVMAFGFLFSDSLAMERGEGPRYQAVATPQVDPTTARGLSSTLGEGLLKEEYGSSSSAILPERAGAGIVFGPGEGLNESVLATASSSPDAEPQSFQGPGEGLNEVVSTTAAPAPACEWRLISGPGEGIMSSLGTYNC